jgi:1-aminocyclopropane-1-carboxylate deaminase/D-cysteine desulfhydrase-like pyridoxal-dependent ACC family enzyme
VQSNHTRQVAAVSAHLGLRCVLAQESWVDWPDVVYDGVGNIVLSRIMGADVRLVRAGFGIGFKESSDPVYDGKSMAGLIVLVTRGEIEPGSKVLYAHLGGQPALNGYAAVFA